MATGNLRVVCALVMVVCLAGAAGAATLYVPDGLPTIQVGIDVAVNGDTVIVRDGIYTEHDIDFGGKAITVRSENGAAGCIIDCLSADVLSAVYFGSGEGADSVFDGFTIMQANHEGIFCSSSSPTIMNNTIMVNGGNGIICFDSSSATITNNLITANGQEGIFCIFFCSVDITNNTIGGNRVGVRCASSSSPTITNNTLSANTTGVLCEESSSPTVTNCIVWGNTSGGIVVVTGAVTATYSCVEGGYPGTGNTASDPLFVDPLFVAPFGGDYHLLPTSQCIDAGDPAFVPVPGETDLDGNPRVFGSAVDMGGYEVTPPPYTGPTWYVDDDAANDPGPGDPSVSDSWEDGSADYPFDAIQKAIDAAVNGDTVIVRDGVYTGTGNHSIRFLGKAITVMSENGAASCIIDGENTNVMGVNFQGGEGADSVLDGFTITATRMGSILCDSFSSPTITNNTVGAGSYWGIRCSESSPVISSNTISGSGHEGIYCHSSSSPTITNNTITLNGYGILCVSSSPTIANNTMSENVDGGILCEDAPATITNCIVWGNTGGGITVLGSPPTVTYSCVEGGYAGTGNIATDPLFVALRFWDGWEWIEGDYHLQPTSPCIDAGAFIATVTDDFEGDLRGVDGTPDPRGDGSDYDMGADEYYVEPIPTLFPVVSTDCPLITTECPAATTTCPVAATQCPDALTECPVATTECPVVSTTCPPFETECPAVATDCPAVSTQCPFVPTTCTPLPIHTECPTDATWCPMAHTECPEFPTDCPVVHTECPELPPVLAVATCPEFGYESRGAEMYVVSLDGTGSSGVVNCLWVQFAGVAVALRNADTLTPDFDPPQWDGSNELTKTEARLGFSLIINQGTPDEDSDECEIYIRIPGDANGDDVVNAFDVAKFRQSPPDPDADMNNDGAVNMFDVAILRQNSGRRRTVE